MNGSQSVGVRVSESGSEVVAPWVAGVGGEVGAKVEDPVDEVEDDEGDGEDEAADDIDPLGGGPVLGLPHPRQGILLRVQLQLAPDAQ